MYDQEGKVPDADLRPSILLAGEWQKVGVREVKTDFPPYSDNRKDWIQVSRIHGVQSVAKLCAHRDMASVVTPIVDLADSAEWMALEDSRGQDFHRWRPQTAGLRGAAVGAFGAVLSGGTKSYSLSGGYLLGSDVATKLAADSWATTTDAMAEICKAMGRFEPAFLHPIERLTSLTWK